MYITSDLYIEDVKRVANLPLPWDSLRGKTILLTGASGLIGTFLVDVMMEKNVVDSLNVKILAVGRSAEKAKERFHDYWANDNFSFLSADLNKPLSIDVHADYVIHAASNTHPRLYADDPVGSLMTNILGTYYLLEYARCTKVERFVFISSVEIYGQALNPDDTFDEKYCGYLDCNQFRAAYPEGKRAGEALCNAYIRKYGMDIVIPRLSRVYGPTMRLDDSKAMSQFIMNGVRGEDIVLKSKGEQRYSYCYVADAVSGILYTMLLGKCGEAYNVADADGTITLREITENIADYMGRKVVFDLPEEQEAVGFSKVSVGVMDTRKLQELGWKAFDDVKSGTRKTVKIIKEMPDFCRISIIDSVLMPVNEKFLETFSEFMDDGLKNKFRANSIRQYTEGILDTLLRDEIEKHMSAKETYANYSWKRKIKCIEDNYDKGIAEKIRKIFTVGGQGSHFHGGEIIGGELQEVIDIAIHLVEDIFIKYFLSPEHKFGTENIYGIFSMLPPHNRVYILQGVYADEKNAAIVDRLSLALLKNGEKERAMALLEDAYSNGVIDNDFKLYQAQKINLLEAELSSIQNLNRDFTEHKAIMKPNNNRMQIIVGYPSSKNIFEAKRAYDLFKVYFESPENYPTFNKLFFYLMSMDEREIQ